MVLWKVDLEIKKGEFVCLIGVNGFGKMILLNVFFGVVQFSIGKVFLYGEDIIKLLEYKCSCWIV